MGSEAEVWVAKVGVAVDWGWEDEDWEETGMGGAEEATAAGWYMVEAERAG